MNERIKELAEQADVLYTKHYDLGSVEVNRQEVEKFAELIVRECANICKESGMVPSVLVSEDILLHFGVEE
jgi:hypothetical protein